MTYRELIEKIQEHPECLDQIAQYEEPFADNPVMVEITFVGFIDGSKLSIA
jgi:hypothetical protein